MQSRHSGAGSYGDPELDRFLAEVDVLLPPVEPNTDRPTVTWPPPGQARSLFPYGVFAPRAFVRR